MPFEEFVPIIYVAVGGTLAYAFYHRFSSIRREIQKKAFAVEKAASKDSGFNKIDEVIANAPQIVAEIDKMILEQKNKGVTDEQLQPLYQKRQMLMLAVQYGDLWNMGGKEIGKALFGLVKGKIGL